MPSKRASAPIPCSDRLAMLIFRDLVLSPATAARLADGEEPGELHEELAERAILAADTFCQKRSQLRAGIAAGRERIRMTPTGE